MYIYQLYLFPYFISNLKNKWDLKDACVCGILESKKKAGNVLIKNGERGGGEEGGGDGGEVPESPSRLK